LSISAIQLPATGCKGQRKNLAAHEPERYAVQRGEKAAEGRGYKLEVQVIQIFMVVPLL
jgi:hypothetical protein